MVRLTLVMIAIFAFAGCKSENPDYCPSHLGMQGCPPDASAVACSSKADCHGADLPACDTTVKGGKCVACTSSDRGACGGDTPRCDNEQCVACVDDTLDCGAGGLCLPSGACAGADSILHAASNGSKTASCASGDACTLETALTTAKAMPGKTVIKLDDAGPYMPEMNFVVDANVTIDMRMGATLHKKDDGPLLEIKAQRTVTLLGGTIEGATGDTGDGILCRGTLTVDGTIIQTTHKSAINMISGCNLTLTRATITSTSLRPNTFVAGIVDNGGPLTISRSTIFNNQGGGISTNGVATTFDITNTFLYRNGSPMANATVGGASLTPDTGSGASPSRFEFNTVVDNQIGDSTTLSGGVTCDKAGFMAPNNIIARNSVNNDATKPNANTVGACTYPTSTVSANMQEVMALKFRSPDMDMPYDYHILPGSSAIGQATTPSSITTDFDNDPRPQNARDQGADQYKP